MTKTYSELSDLGAFRFEIASAVGIAEFEVEARKSLSENNSAVCEDVVFADYPRFSGEEGERLHAACLLRLPEADGFLLDVLRWKSYSFDDKATYVGQPSGYAGREADPELRITRALLRLLAAPIEIDEWLGLRIAFIRLRKLAKSASRLAVIEDFKTGRMTLAFVVCASEPL